MKFSFILSFKKFRIRKGYLFQSLHKGFIAVYSLFASPVKLLFHSLISIFDLLYLRSVTKRDKKYTTRDFFHSCQTSSQSRKRWLKFKSRWDFFKIIRNVVMEDRKEETHFFKDKNRIRSGISFPDVNQHLRVIDSLDSSFYTFPCWYRTRASDVPNHPK